MGTSWDSEAGVGRLGFGVERWAEGGPGGRCRDGGAVIGAVGRDQGMSLRRGCGDSVRDEMGVVAGRRDVKALARMESR